MKSLALNDPGYSRGWFLGFRVMCIECSPKLERPPKTQEKQRRPTMESPVGYEETIAVGAIKDHRVWQLLTHGRSKYYGDAIS